MFTINTVTISTVDREMSASRTSSLEAISAISTQNFWNLEVSGRILSANSQKAFKEILKTENKILESSREQIC